MKTPWRIQDLNTGKIRITFGAICFVVFVVVGLMGLKRGLDNRPPPESSFSVKEVEGALKRSAEMAAWVAETKEPVKYFDSTSQLTSHLIQKNIDLLVTDRLNSKTIKMYQEIVAVLESGNAALKKRIDELEKCVDTIELGGIRYPTSYKISPNTMPPLLIDAGTTNPPNTFGRMYWRSTNNHIFTVNNNFDGEFVPDVDTTGRSFPASFFTP